MKNSKLIFLLKTFDSKELRAFGDYVMSPYFNKNQELVDFYFFLKKVAPEFAAKKIDKAFVYKKVFPENDFDAKHLHYIMSFLLKLAENFVAQIEYQDHNILPDYHLLSALTNRKLKKHYDHTLRKANLRLEKHLYRDADFYFDQYLISDVNNRHFQKMKLREFNNSLQIASDFFDLYFISNKLRFVCEMIDRQNILVVDYKMSMIPFIKEYLKVAPLKDEPYIELYYKILLLKSEGLPDQYFEDLKILMEKYMNYFPMDEQKQIFIHLINFAIRKIREGEQKYVEECLDLYLYGIEKRIVFDKGFLSPWTFKNVVRLGIRLKKYEWTKNFIAEKSGLLSDEFKDDLYNFTIADYYFTVKDYAKAIYHFNQLGYADIHTILNAKTRILQIYYDTEEWDVLESGIVSFNQFLRRNKKVSSAFSAPFENFIKIISKLVKADKYAKKELSDLVDSTKSLWDIDWFKEKISNL